MRASRGRKARVSFDAINEVDVAVGEVDMTGKDEIELVHELHLLTRAPQHTEADIVPAILALPLTPRRGFAHRKIEAPNAVSMLIEYVDK
jgi:hypothetical protein